MGSNVPAASSSWPRLHARSWRIRSPRAAGANSSCRSPPRDYASTREIFSGGAVPGIDGTRLTPRSVARGPKSQGALFLLSFATLVLSAAGAYAADADKASNEISFLVALLALVLVGRLLGEAMNRIGQPSVMGQLFAGILLGPSALGVVLPDLQQWLFAASKEQASMLDAISQFGILLLVAADRHGD